MKLSPLSIPQIYTYVTTCNSIASIDNRMSVSVFVGLLERTVYNFGLCVFPESRFVSLVGRKVLAKES